MCDYKIKMAGLIALLFCLLTRYENYGIICAKYPPRLNGEGKIMKRYVIFLILIALILPLFSCSQNNVSVIFEYRLNDDLRSYSISNATLLVPTDVVIPSEHKGLPITNIDSSAFNGCGFLKSVVIPETVTSIGSWAFGYCVLLTSVKIPASVSSINHQAFEESPSLTMIEVDKDSKYFQSIDGNLYTKDGKELIKYAPAKQDTSFVLPASVETIKSNALWMCRFLTNIEVSQNNKYYKSIDGNLYSKDETKLIKYAIGKKDVSFSIPDTVDMVFGEAFLGCTSLESIEIPNSVTWIGGGAFEDCTSLTSIEIPDSVTRIEDWTFSGCYSLTTIIIPDSVTSIGGWAFEYSGLTSIKIPNSVTSIGDYAFSNCSSLTSVTIPDSITRIENGTFASCHSLTTITIPASVTRIGVGALGYCRSLTSIVFEGTVEQWKSITKDIGWDMFTDHNTIYCTDGQIAKNGTITYK